MDDLNWDSFVDSYYDPIFAYCHQFLGNKNDAEDAVQDTFLRAWKHFLQLKDQTAVKSWIYSIARRACLDRLRAVRRFLSFWAAREQKTFHSPEHDLKLTLLKLVGCLPKMQRQVFILRHWHGFSTEETAQLLDLSPGTVKSHLKRAVDHLKAALNSQQPTVSTCLTS